MMMAKLEKDESKKKQAYEEVRTKMESEVHGVLKKAFRPEFLNRIDDIIIFEALSLKEIEQIVDLQIAELQSRLDDKKISLSISDSAKKYIAKNGYDPLFGARPLKRYIQKHIENPLSMMIIEGDLIEGGEVNVEEKDGEIVIS